MLLGHKLVIQVRMVIEEFLTGRILLPLSIICQQLRTTNAYDGDKGSQHWWDRRRRQFS